MKIPVASQSEIYAVNYFLRYHILIHIITRVVASAYNLRRSGQGQERKKRVSEDSSKTC